MENYIISKIHNEMKRKKLAGSTKNEKEKNEPTTKHEI